MSSTSWAALIIGIVIIAGGYFSWSSQQSMMNNTAETTEPVDVGAASNAMPVQGSEGVPEMVVENQDTPAASNTGAVPALTMAAVATHNTKESCWSVIDGNVYDLTSWISKHPGGERAILSLCGTDGSSTFHGKHGDNKKQADILAGFKLGALAQ